jgi:hypothetical protein
MHKSAALFSCTLFLAVCVAPMFAATKTVTGQLVDLACYGLDKENTGIAHKAKGHACGPACAREGFPVGLLATDGMVYQVTGELAAHANAKLAPHISHTVTVTGEVGEKDGVPTISGTEIKMAGQ